jgi:hypothetical protein
MIYLCDWCKSLLKITRERPGEIASSMCMTCIDQYTMEECSATYWPPNDNWQSLWVDIGGEGG